MAKYEGEYETVEVEKVSPKGRQAEEKESEITWFCKCGNKRLLKRNEVCEKCGRNYECGCLKFESRWY